MPRFEEFSEVLTNAVVLVNPSTVMRIRAATPERTRLEFVDGSQVTVVGDIHSVRSDLTER